MENKSSIFEEILKSLLIYFLLIIIYGFYYQIIGIIEGDASRSSEFFLYIFMVAVSGVFCYRGSCGSFLDLGIPFLPAILSIGSIFLVLHFLNLKVSYFRDNKNKIDSIFKKIFIVVIAVNMLLMLLGSISDWASSRNAESEEKYFSDKYETDEEIKFVEDFIRVKKICTVPDSNSTCYEYSTIISKLDGSQERALQSFKAIGIDKYRSPWFISPGGNYYIMSKNNNYGNSGFEVRGIKGEIIFNVMDRKLDYNSILKWSDDEKYFVIREDRGLAIYDIKNREKHILISGSVLSFDWGASSNYLYLQNNDGIYVIDNIEEFSDSKGNIDARNVKMENIMLCSNIEYHQGNIYCFIAADKIGKEIEDKRNKEIEGKNHFIISQNINQKSKDNYKIVNNAPLDQTNRIFISDGYIYGGGRIINIETGKHKEDYRESLVTSSDSDGLSSAAIKYVNIE